MGQRETYVAGGGCRRLNWAGRVDRRGEGGVGPSGAGRVDGRGGSGCRGPWGSRGHLWYPIGPLGWFDESSDDS